MFLFIEQRCHLLVVIQTFAQNVGTFFLSREYWRQCAAPGARSAFL